MKRYITAVFLAAFFLTVLSGCGLFTFALKMDAAEDAAERKLDQMEAAAEQAAQDALSTERLRDFTLSGEDAWSIALEHAGLTLEEVEGLRAEGEIDDGVPRYEVQFHVGRVEYEYEIHAETGEILSFERDD